MAEAAVITLMKPLISKIAEKLFEEASGITSFKEDFEMLCSELVSVESILKEAGQKRNSSLTTNWFEKLEDFIDDAEDIVEECEAPYTVGKLFFRKLDDLVFRYKMSRRMKTLKKKINNIHNSAKYLQYFISVVDANFSVANNSEDRRERSSYLLHKKTHLVGMDDDIDVVTKLILQEEGAQVIGVVGMGGLGKTFLVQHVFNGDKLKERFDYRVWLAISQSYEVKQLLLEVSKHIDLKLDHNEEMTPQELRAKVHTHLEGKRCLFVLDDVWNSHVFKEIDLPWECQNKFVVTSREKSVVEAMGSHYLHDMKCLSKENSLKLFCMYAFSDRSDNSPPEELRCIAEGIVEKCCGLPLAVTTIGANMASVRNNDWESTLHRLNQAQARTIRDDIRPSLRLSYEALPDNVKPCFIFCSHFPKNTEIECKYLVYAWIAQGFVSTQEGGEETYEVGLSYFQELIDRCLLEISKFGEDGQVEFCKMHDLLHDLAVSESEKQTKCLLKPGGDLTALTVKGCRGVRRISLMKNKISTIEEAIHCPGLRTLLLSGNSNLTSIPASFFKNLKYLTVIDLSYTTMKSLPETIGDLKHLKFLSLSGTKIEELPESLSGLQRLQFLDVSYCYDLKRLHSGIGEHKFMLYLNLNGCLNLGLLPGGISRLINLRTFEGAVFRTVNANSASALQLRDLKGLTLLQHLSLTFESEIQLEEGAFVGMTNMRTLSIYNFHGRLVLPKDMEVMKRLERVTLSGCEVPDWIFKLQNLMVLYLSGHNNSTADYKGLEKIHRLRTLSLEDNNKLVEFPEDFGKAMAFPKLENLIIQGFDCLEKLPLFQDSAMPMLKSFYISFCPLLKDIPQGLERLNNLENVDVLVTGAQQAEDIRTGQCWECLKNCQTKIKVRMLDSLGIGIVDKIGYGQ